MTVTTFGESNDFPSFYTQKSGFKSTYYCNSYDKAASLIKANRQLELQSGMVFAVPIPEQEEYPYPEQLEKVIQEAVKEADTLNIKGKDITPFLLGKVKALTQGKSLQSSIRNSFRHCPSQEQCSSRESNRLVFGWKSCRVFIPKRKGDSKRKASHCGRHCFGPFS